MSHYECKKCHKRYDDCSCDSKPAVTHDVAAIKAALVDELGREPWSDELEDFEVIEDGRWSDEGKTESKKDIIRHTPSGVYYEVCFSRYGDHWQGYETSFESCVQVTAYLKTVTAWKRVQ